MKKIAVINQELCDKSPFCPVRRICPQNAIITHKGKKKNIFSPGIEKYEIDSEKCTACSLCLKYCPMRAVSLKERS